MTILLFAFGLLGVASAKVGERYLYSGAVCQKSEAMTEFLNQWDGINEDELLLSLNTKAGHEACMLGEFIVEEVARTTIVSTTTGTWQLTELNVSGFIIEGIAVTFGESTHMFTYTSPDEESAGQPT